MTFEELIILLPCHSLEDFPLHHEAETADGLLSAWVALWHPALVAAAGRTVSWQRAEYPPETLAGRLIVIPEVSEPLLMAGWPARAAKEGACVIRKIGTLDEIVAAALAELDGAAEGAARLDADLVEEFFALGYAYLQTELLTRQMRYMSLLDETHLSDETRRAAEAAVAGDAETARAHLRNCYDTLSEAKERFYPVDTYLIDLTLLAETTVGASLRRWLSESVMPQNFLLCGKTLQHMAEHEPESLAALRQAVEQGRASVVGGEYLERELPMFPMESVLYSLRHGAGLYGQHLGHLPHVFGRRRHGLTPVLPQLLVRSGIEAALHATLDEGHFPRSPQSKLRWEGIDGTTVETLGRVPIDAGDAGSFLKFPEHMGQAMDYDPVATLVFAHWPGQASRWYRIVQRVAGHCPVLGRFMTLDQYFRDTSAPAELTQFQPDQYRTPYLQQAVIRKEPDPLSRLIRLHRRRAMLAAGEALETMVGLLSQQPAHSAVAGLAERIEAAHDARQAAAELDAQLEQLVQQAAEQFAQQVPHASSAGGIYVLNPLNFQRRILVELPESAPPPAEQPPVYAAQSDGDACAVVEVPAMGYAFVAASTSPPPGRSKKQPTVVDELALKNEFFEVIVDEASGAIRSVRSYKVRGTRLSQQLAFRLPAPRPRPGETWRDPDSEARYTSMVADSVQTTRNGSTLGEVQSRGRLVDDEGRVYAAFTQTVRVWRGSPYFLLDVALDVQEEPRADPWNSYYAARFAWSDAAADLWRSANEGRHPTDAKRIEAPDFIEIEDGDGRVTIFPGGLPYHRRMGMRMLDTLLVVRGESQRRFRMGIGLDIPHPMATAMELFVPPLVVPAGDRQPKPGSSAWLFHVDARNVIATHWAPWFEEGRLLGFRARLLETEGRAGRVRLRCFGRPAQARQVDFHGKTLCELKHEGDTVFLDFTAFEWVQLECRFADEARQLQHRSEA